MKRILRFILLGFMVINGAVFFSACQKEEEASGYLQITPDEAKELMDTKDDYVILDTRTKDEFDDGHIDKAVLIPYDEIENRAEDELSRKDQLILVYCRSGRRSKIAAQALADLGYTNVKEFGGIIDWPYDIVK